MPFTLSHPATAVLLWGPIRRGRVPLIPFAIGAMVPDFEYFIHLRPLSLWSHSPLGLFAFCLPVGLLALALWQFVLREPMRALFNAAERPAPSLNESRAWMLAAIGILLGAVSHVVIDGLTHGGRWGERLFPALGHPVPLWSRRTVPLFIVLDYVGTVAGGALVLHWLTRNVTRAHVRAFVASGWRVAVVAALVIISLAAGWLNAAYGPLAGRSGPQLWVARFAVAAMMGLAGGAIIYGVVARRTLAIKRL